MSIDPVFMVPGTPPNHQGRTGVRNPLLFSRKWLLDANCIPYSDMDILEATMYAYHLGSMETTGFTLITVH